MIIWFVLLVPLIAIIILISFWGKKLAWWEILILAGVSIGLIAIMKVTGTASVTRDTEYWGDLVERAEYYEEYEIWDHETCYHQVPCGTDSKGNTEYCTESYDCSHADYHSPYWRVITTSGWNLYISQNLWQRLIKKFGAVPIFKDMNRESELGFGDYIMKDGDMYYIEWPKTPKTSYMVATTHHYENRVQCSRSLFNPRPVSPEEVKKNALFDYPYVNNDYDVPTILGTLIPNQSEAEEKFKFLNGDLGPKKQVRVWVLLFRNQPLSTGLSQEAYWKRGNMNEFVVTIGLDYLNNVKWCHAFSWMANTTIAVETRDFVTQQKKLDLVQLADFLYKEINAKWVRRDFKKEFSYITVEPPTWSIIVALIINVLFNIGFGWWSVKNDFTFANPKGEYNSRY